ncbi:cation:proton antiporter, partial [Nocardiopsis rhodophaea]|uniref:cation:proton antiporter domain-containing protein n=1 Tax=Nocardiopsis rhodophaea TaxID=280238 RepID=UPI0039EFB395
VRERGPAMMLAAGETPEFLGPVVALLSVAGLIGALCVRLRVVPIVGFLLAGVVIGPHQLGVVADVGHVRAAADIGVMLLLFTIGIEFSLERLAKIRRYVLLGGSVQVVATVALTAAVVVAAGQDWRIGVFTGFLVALSSTAIVIKIVAAKGMTSRPTGQVAVGILIFQDLAVVVMVLLIPLLAGVTSRGAGGEEPWGIVRALGTAALVLTAVMVVARKVMPPLLERVARLCSPEIFLLTIVAIALGVAYLTSLAGVSDALGAFLAGMVLSESRHSAHALSEIMPLQILFSAVFFVSIGMLLDVGVVVELWWLVAVLALAVVAIKLAAGYLAASTLRVGAPTVVAGAFLLPQIGEFSFVLQQVGAASGMSPLGLGDQGAQLLVAVTVVLMTATPALAAVGERLARTVGVRQGHRAAVAPRDGAEHRPEQGRVLVSGWGPVAQYLGGYLRARGIPVTVTTLNPDLAAQAEAEGHRVVRGEVIKAGVLHDVGMDQVRLIVICEHSGEETTHIAEALRNVAPGVPIVARPVDSVDVSGLSGAGVTRVVDSQRAVAQPLTRTVLDVLGAEHLEVPRPDPTVVVDFAPDAAAACPHAEEIRPVLPKSPGCTTCLSRGRTDWVHLRICLTCGYVGCCDSSPGRHAQEHAGSVGHPIAVSAEPGEVWAWCFLDEAEIGPAQVDASTS